MSGQEVRFRSLSGQVRFINPVSNISSKSRPQWHQQGGGSVRQTTLDFHQDAHPAAHRGRGDAVVYTTKTSIHLRPKEPHGNPQQGEEKGKEVRPSSDMLGNKKTAASAVNNGAGTSQSKTIDPLRNLGELAVCFSDQSASTSDLLPVIPISCSSHLTSFIKKLCLEVRWTEVGFNIWNSWWLIEANNLVHNQYDTVNNIWK